MRYEKIAELCRNISADAILLSSEENCRYATSFGPFEGMTVVTADGECYLFTDMRYTEAAEKNAQGVKVVTVTEGMYKHLADFFCNKGIKNVAYEDLSVTVASFSAMEQKIDANWIKLGTSVNKIRNVKDSLEVDSMIKAQRIAETAFENVKNYVKAGVTEKQLAARLDYEMNLLGSEGVSFDTIFISGSNTSMPHGVPSDKVLENGDFITVDFGAVYNGYHSDMTRTFALGYATDEMREVYDAVLHAQLEGIEAVDAGVPCKVPYERAMTALGKWGKYFTHSLGHGVGLAIHEGYSLSPKSDDILEKGNIITVEPGVYRPGKFGVRIEDVIWIAEEKVNLMKTPKELMIL